MLPRKNSVGAPAVGSQCRCGPVRGILRRMMPFLFLTLRWLFRLAVLAMSVIMCAGFAVETFGKNYLALAAGASLGIFWWWCAVFDVPEWAGGEPRVWRRGFCTRAVKCGPAGGYFLSRAFAPGDPCLARTGKKLVGEHRHPRRISAVLAIPSSRTARLTPRSAPR